MRIDAIFANKFNYNKYQPKAVCLPKADLFIEAKEKSEKICKKYNIKMGPLCKPCTHNVL